MPEKIRMCMEKGKKIGDGLNADKDNNKISSLINDCINVENHVLDIENINSTLERSDSYKNIKIKFLPNENEIFLFIKILRCIYKQRKKWKVEKIKRIFYRRKRMEKGMILIEAYLMN